MSGRCCALTHAPVSALLRAASARGDAAPGVVALVADSRRVLYHDAVGMLSVADGIPMPLDAIFRIMSMTKPLTSVAALRLVERGWLDVEAPVSAYLPSFVHPEVLTGIAADGRAETRPPRETLTIRHLLTHTGGYGYGFSDSRLLQLTRATGTPEWQLPLLHDPGARFTYGVGTKVLGDVIAAIAGMPLDEVLRRWICEPLGMLDTCYRVPAEKAGRVVRRHHRTAPEEPNDDPEQAPVSGATGLYSTAADYGLFLQLMLNGGAPLLSSHAFERLTSDAIAPLVVEQQPAADPARACPFPWGAGRDGFSFGFQVTAAERSRRHRSAGSLSWSGLRNTHFWIDRQRGIGALIFMQLLPFYDSRAMDVVEEFELAVNS